MMDQEEKPINLLLIEDDLIDQKAFQLALQASSGRYTCVCVLSIAEARLVLKGQLFDIIISDYRLGDGTALDLFPVLSIPMIIVTGVGDEEIAVRALKAGAHDYLVKDHDRNYLKVLPITVETVLRRQQLEVNEREQRVLASALQDTALALTSTLKLNEVLERILVNVQKVVPHDRANIMLIDGEEARIVQCSDGYPAHVGALSFTVSHNEPLKLMYETQTPCLIVDVPQPSNDIYFVNTITPASYLGAPLITNNQVIGFINLDSWKREQFVPIYAERLQAFAAQAAVALENARLYQHSYELAALQERQQIARDLHDSVTQTLFSATIMSESVITLWRQDPTQIETELLELHNMTRGVLAEMRTLLFELRPDILATASLDDLLYQLIDTLRGRSHIVIEADITSQEPVMLPVAVKIAFFRIAQEALNNVAKHARARCVRITFHCDEANIFLSVSDDGRGFDSSMARPGRLGLRMMQERAQATGITWSIDSAMGHGTKVMIQWQQEV
jgi:signal transduction histidine kinase